MTYRYGYSSKYLYENYGKRGNTELLVSVNGDRNK